MRLSRPDKQTDRQPNCARYWSVDQCENGSPSAFFQPAVSQRAMPEAAFPISADPNHALCPSVLNSPRLRCPAPRVEFDVDDLSGCCRNLPFVEPTLRGFAGIWPSSLPTAFLIIHGPHAIAAPSFERTPEVHNASCGSSLGRYYKILLAIDSIARLASSSDLMRGMLKAIRSAPASS